MYQENDECLSCPELKTKHDFVRHVKCVTLIKLPLWLCKFCFKSFDKSKRLTRHMRKEHQLKTIKISKSVTSRSRKCPICFKFLAPQNVKSHIINVHKISRNADFFKRTPKEPFKCLICEKKYPEKKLLQTHLNRIHGEQSSECNKCQ